MNVAFKTFSEAVSEARMFGIIDDRAFSDLLKIGYLRNKVYHEGYIPRRGEAESILNTAREFIELLEKC